MWHMGFSQWRPLFVDSRRQIARSQNRSRMCEMHLTKLSCVAQRVGIVHFYAVTEIKGLSCRMWWMRKWRNLLTSTHVGYPVCHTGSRGWRITKIFGSKVQARLTDFCEITARKITGFDCIMYSNIAGFWVLNIFSHILLKNELARIFYQDI